MTQIPSASAPPRSLLPPLPPLPPLSPLPRRSPLTPLTLITPRTIPARIVFACGLLLALTTPASAAVGDHVWSQGYPATGQASVDPSGAVVCAGTFFGPVDFGGGTFSPVNFFGGDGFIARYDAAGAHVWSVQFTPGGFGLIVQAVAAGPAGELYVAGVFQNGDVDFGGGLIGGSGEGFLAAFDASGNHLWSFVVGTGTPRGLDADGTRVVVTGNTYGTMDFGGGPLTSAGGSDTFLAAYTSAGAHVWSALYGDGADQGGWDVALDGAGNAFLASSTLGTVDFGGGPLAAGSGADLCLARFTAAGAHDWSAVYAGTFTPGGGALLDVSVDASPTHGLVVAGEMSGTVDFGGGALTSLGSMDAFVVVLDNAGSHQWSASHGGSSADASRGVCFDASGNVAVAGTFLSSPAGFGGAAFTPSGIGGDFFAALYDSAGAHVWSDSYGLNGQWGIDVACAGSSAIQLWGTGAPGIDFGGGALADAEFFLARLEGVSASQSAVEGIAPVVTKLYSSPNPFHLSTSIRFSLEKPALTRVLVVDLQGRSVALLVDESLPAGSHHVTWDGRSSRGTRAADGIYFIQVSAAGSSEVTKIVRLR